MTLGKIGGMSTRLVFFGNILVALSDVCSFVVSSATFITFWLSLYNSKFFNLDDCLMRGPYHDDGLGLCHVLYLIHV